MTKDPVSSGPKGSGNQVTGSGTNSRGNGWQSFIDINRPAGPDNNGYHYDNMDGSQYTKYVNGDTVHRTKTGGEIRGHVDTQGGGGVKKEA